MARQSPISNLQSLIPANSAARRWGITVGLFAGAAPRTPPNGASPSGLPAGA
ncbi:MAG: hypothetical protein MUD01_26960 [Chloroflexaceae bacterium]|nr:hypothetical protein [Chloroflexaceae bacterium]